MSKKRIIRGIITVIVFLLLLAAGTALLFMPKKAAAHPDFSSMPTDTAGYNLIGNLHENLEAGGFMAGQNGWIYFANFSDGGKLYMCRENGADMVKITDFPVCNINVMGSSVVFTGLDFSALDIGNQILDEKIEPDWFSNKDSPLSGISLYFTSNYVSLGGKLYAIYGVNSASKPRFCVIDPDTVCFSPYLDRDGLYSVCVDEQQTFLANQSNDTKMVITREGEYINQTFSYGNIIYVNVFSESDKKSRIIRVDAKTLFPLDYINGSYLHRVGNSFVFQGEDGYIYEITPSNGTINPISAEPVNTFYMNPFGEIIADSGQIIISKEQRYGSFAETFLSRRKSTSITMQNGWYSYYSATSRYGGEPYFRANNEYYSIKDSGWSADWLNTKLDTEPLVSLDDLIVEDLFTPTWIDFSEEMEPIDPAGVEDFGSERPVRPAADTRADASSDEQNALDAAIMLLCEDEDIADKYTGESVEKLRNQYGAAFDTALTGAASKLSKTLASRFGMDINPQETRDLLTVWLQNTSYDVGDARVSSNGKEASIALTVQKPVDVGLLYDMIAEAGDAERSYAEIMRDPEQHGLMSSLPENESAQIYMRVVNDDCWIAESPDKLLHIFIQGLD